MEIKKVMDYVEQRIKYYDIKDMECRNLLNKLTGSNEFDILKYGVTHSDLYKIHQLYITIITELLVLKSELQK